MTVRAIVGKDGRIDISSLSWTRRDAISKWNNNPKYPWKYWRDKHGCRALKVCVALAKEGDA